MTISRVDQGTPPPVSPTDGNTYTSLAQNKLCMPRLLTAILTPTPPDHSSSFFFFFRLIKFIQAYISVSCVTSVQFSLLPDWLLGGTRGRFSRDPLPVFSSGGLCEQFWHVPSLMLSMQHFLCGPQRHLPSKVSWRVFLERLSWRVAYPNHVSFGFLPVARRGFYGRTRKLIFLRIVYYEQ